jgi:hypothetical protein
MLCLAHKCKTRLLVAKIQFLTSICMSLALSGQGVDQIAARSRRLGLVIDGLFQNPKILSPDKAAC